MRHFPLLVANWKMYPSFADGIVIANGVKKALEDIGHVEVVLCPPSVMIPEVHNVLSSHSLANLHLGAQNIHQLEEGGYTGEISARMLKGLVKYVIVGHSERVKWFHETPHETNLKIKVALDNNLTPIVAVGEPHQGAGAIRTVVNKLKGQILHGLSAKQLAQIIIAYEPIWAIWHGSDSTKPATGEYAQQVCAEIRKLVGQQTRILYGGSTSPDNIAEFLSQDDIDGALVGHESVNLKNFIKMCEIAATLR